MNAAGRALDAEHLAAALALARSGRPAHGPRAGARVVLGRMVVGEACRSHDGGVAERLALGDAGGRSKGATLYTTIEPVDAGGVAGAGVARVVVGALHPLLRGAAIEELRARGIEVETGVLERECEDEIEDFACLTLLRRPLVTMKAAVTLDGRIASRTGDSKWITGEAARREAHVMRERAGAVMVGIGTVLADDPSLRAHMLERSVDPHRIVLDTHLRTPPTANVVAERSSAPTWIVHGPAAHEERRDALTRSGAECIASPEANGRVDLALLIAELGRRKVRHILVEGGALLHGALLDADLVDRAAIFVAPLVLGDRDARPLAERAHPAHTIREAHRLTAVTTQVLGGDVLIEGRLHPHPLRSR